MSVPRPEYEIDPMDPDPVYVQLAGILRRKIESGEFPPRTKLPSESTLMQESGLSRGSVRHALSMLADENLIRIIQGRGSYVLARGT